MDLAMLCRSCMNEVASWELQNFDTRIVEMFYFCTNIKITDEDKLPKQFCYNCTIKIESVYTFIVEAQKVNVTLKNIVSRDTSVIVQLDSQTNNIEPNVNNLKEHIKLTLPDYKISASIATYDEQVIFEDTDEQNMEKDSNEEHTKENGINTSSPIQELESNQQVIKDKEEVKDIKLGELKKNICAVCRKGFTSKAWFNKHMQKEHTGHKYACAHCPKTFSKPGQLSYHAASHSEERRFACTMCDKRFKRRKQLAAHARSHTDVRPFACDQCSMRFKLKSVLKCHMKVHENDKPYLCSFCGWSFAQAGNLWAHVRVHTGERPFACGACSFRARASSSLRRHQRRHAARPAHTCTHCHKAFYDASGLARHMRTHSGERPYACPGCARRFTDSWKRKTHLMRAHTLALHDIPRMRRDGQPIT